MEADVFNEFDNRWLDTGRWIACYQGALTMPANFEIKERAAARADRS